MKYDFGGYVTKNDLKCTDGRTIRHGAFQGCDGKRVPLVYMHQHRELDNVLGHVDLEVRDDGVYGYGTFNNTPQGQGAKEMVRHGDLTQMSIFANQLQERGKDVFHGVIREVSLVLAGANPGAVIDNLNLVHSDGSFELVEDEATIRPGFDIELYHADDEVDDEAEKPEANSETDDGENQNDRTIQDVIDGMSEKKQKVMKVLIGLAVQQAQGEDIEDITDEGDDSVQHADEGGETIQDVFDTFTDEEKDVTYFLIAKAVEEADSESSDETDKTDKADEDESLAQYDEEGAIMHHNIFETGADDNVSYLTHADMEGIFKDARSRGSLKDAWSDFAAENEVSADSLQHGITNIDTFFPEAQAVSNQPALISRRMEWVAGVLSAVHHTPFSKVKSTAANLTADEARARGYIKGNQKVQEQITALKRVTGPTTVYKLQKLDRDDVVDITDFDIVVWMKAEMRMMLDEEVARAYLIGDGRLASSNDKINESCIRPIWTDDEVYAIHSVVTKDADPAKNAKNFIDACIRARKNYKGSGSPALYVGQDLLTEMRLIRDELGHRLYKNDQELADELRVSKIVEIELFDGQTRKVNSVERELGGIVVNLADYNVGATRGGEVNLFDDFDLNFNKLEYLIETRQSGALVQPASALVIEFVEPTE